MADAPPPPEPALADVAPERLQAFLWYLVRDLVPPGYVDHCLSRAMSPAESPSYATNPEMAAMTNRWARTLAYVATPDPG